LNTHEDRAVDYVGHIIDAIDRIGTYTIGFDEAQFLANGLVQDGVIRQLLVVGEASNRLTRQCPEFSAAHPEVAWKSSYDTRNRLVHGYATINPRIVWKIVVNELPPLRAQMQRLLDGFQK
jgi:uncharacterized protein with HEPN domain